MRFEMSAPQVVDFALLTVSGAQSEEASNLEGSGRETWKDNLSDKQRFSVLKLRSTATKINF